LCQRNLGQVNLISKASSLCGVARVSISRGKRGHLSVVWITMQLDAAPMRPSASVMTHSPMARHLTELLRLLAKHYVLVSDMCRESRRFSSDAELEAFCASFLEAGTGATLLAGRLKDVGVVS